MLRKLVTMRDALADPGYFGQVFSGESLATWRALLIAALGEELTETERALFQAVAGMAAKSCCLSFSNVPIRNKILLFASLISDSIR
jgi:hypothetical protein